MNGYDAERLNVGNGGIGGNHIVLELTVNIHTNMIYPWARNVHYEQGTIIIPTTETGYNNMMTNKHRELKYMKNEKEKGRKRNGDNDKTANILHTCQQYTHTHNHTHTHAYVHTVYNIFISGWSF